MGRAPLPRARGPWRVPPGMLPAYALYFAVPGPPAGLGARLRCGPRRGHLPPRLRRRGMARVLGSSAGGLHRAYGGVYRLLVGVSSRTRSSGRGVSSIVASGYGELWPCACGVALLLVAVAAAMPRRSPPEFAAPPALPAARTVAGLVVPHRLCKQQKRSPLIAIGEWHAARLWKSLSRMRAQPILNKSPSLTGIQSIASPWRTPGVRAPTSHMTTPSNRHL